ncbi:hypothetical protein ACFE04_030968 [Oxalis oulophora]
MNGKFMTVTEFVPVACVVDEELSNGCSNPWESFAYITKPMTDQSLDLDGESLELGCTCSRSSCSPETCDHEGYLVYECNSMCNYNKTCPNRVLQNGVQGWAVRVGEPILGGTFVCKLIGEVLDELEANKRRTRFDFQQMLHFFDYNSVFQSLTGILLFQSRIM